MCTQIDFSDDDLLPEKNNGHQNYQSYGDSGATGATSYNNEPDTGQNRFMHGPTRDANTFQHTSANSFKSNRYASGTWRTQSACEGLTPIDLTFDPKSARHLNQNKESIPAMAAYDEFREKIQNRELERDQFREQLQSAIVRAHI